MIETNSMPHRKCGSAASEVPRGCAAMAALFLNHGLLRAAYPCKFALRGNHGGERHAIYPRN